MFKSHMPKKSNEVRVYSLKVRDKKGNPLASISFSGVIGEIGVLTFDNDVLLQAYNSTNGRLEDIKYDDD